MIDNNISSGKVKNGTVLGKFCTINICGLSQRSNMMLSKYASDNDILLFGVQETGSSSQWKSLTNMKTFEDTNNNSNKGCAIIVKHEVMFTQLPVISNISSNIDSVWGMLSWNGKRYIIGNLYLKLDYLSGVKEMLAMLEKAHELSKLHKCAGVITMGDFNARHFIWNDTVVNQYGKYIEEHLDWSKFCVHAPSSSTFLARNGSSHIDFFITSTQLDKYIDHPIADHFANLYSGAPLRGHVPVSINVQSQPVAIRSENVQKYNLQSMDWIKWTKDIEVDLTPEKTDSFATDGTIKELLEVLNSAIDVSTKENCQMKCVSKHSKPYWTPKLSLLSGKLRLNLKSYLTRNTDTAFEALQTSKNEFEEARKQACQQFILRKTNDLNTSQAKKFWKEFNKLFKPPSNQMVEALISEDGTILTENAVIEKEMFGTFFQAKHIEHNIDQFDDAFYQEINNLYDDIKNSNFQPNEEMADKFTSSSALYCPVTPWEITATLKGIHSTAASFDNHEVHQSMLRKLGPNAIYALSKLFTLCLRNGRWLWNDSKIVFLKKEGKSSYSKAGAYRPISISSYVGKLLERILAQRLEIYLNKVGIIDVNQEGFSKGKNTIRYLNRLTVGIKGDIMKKLTVLCLFIDFEKAFDSVWKKGLVVKLWRAGVHGCYLKTIDSFLFSRTVCLLINGFLGPVRDCLDYGLPQGSVLSPILFKFFIMDIEAVCSVYEQISVLKFADDGTVKVVGRDLEECLFYLNLAMDSIEYWTSCWRLVINCNVNKTEIICFNSYDHAGIPTSFTLGGKQIHLTDQTKVLGVILDSKLTYKKHSKHVYNNLVYRWVCMSRYANRNWGMNQAVLVRVAKTILFSTLFYGSIIWMKNSNMTDINKLWYRVSKSAVGAVFNVQGAILEVILGVPPLQTMGRVISIKHYLKVLHDSHDIHFDFVRTQLDEMNPTVLCHLRDVQKFLIWKIEHFSTEAQAFELSDIAQRNLDQILLLPQKTYKYTKGMIQQFTELLWQESIQNLLAADDRRMV